MFKRWRCYVASLLCLCCTFATLSLNTLQVEAASFDFSPTFRISLSPSAVSNSTYGSTSGSNSVTGSIYNGTGNITGNGSITGSVNSVNEGIYHYHLVLPFDVNYGVGISPDLNSYYQIITRWNGSPTITSSFGSVNNFMIKNADGSVLFSGSPSAWYGSREYVPGKDLIGNYGNNTAFKKSYIIECDLDGIRFVNSDLSGSDLNVDISFNSFNFWIDSYDIGQNNAQPVTDVQANVKLDNIKTSSDTTATNTTDIKNNTSSILTRITDFFGAFFQNFIDSLKSLFIPEDGYFTNWFNRLNTLLSAKLGMLYAPFDLVISVLTALGSASTDEAGIPFPELAWDGQVIIPAQTFYFSSLGSSFSDLRDAVYFATDVVLLFAFLVLLQRKINLVMRGSEEG